MTTPVIINKSLEKSVIDIMLRKLFKVRVAEGTVKNSVIFPKNSVAFLIQSIEELYPSLKNSFDVSVIERVQKFMRLHRNAYIFLISDVGFQNILLEIQKMFLNEDVTFLPCTGVVQCFNMINEIILSKEPINDKMADAKKLSEGIFSENIICDIIENNVRISQHDAMVAQDGCQTVANLSRASIEQLMEFSLSVETANKVRNFFLAKH
ncbi:uncharacterized protein LOC101237604 isoform X3 [Hydra vulgaris]|uniref:Uncharacterized protein LOC101237604 isoform X3 n=1 Tax=Hydra vulgaris TaxID=6087 RepID=A0ABM4CYA8_HYDVU